MPPAARGTDDAATPAGPVARGDGAETHGAAETEAPAERIVVDPSTIRRSPRYLAFAFTGAAVGALLSVLLAVLPIGASETSTGTLIGMLMLGLVPAGVFLGLVAAVVLDRRSLRAVEGTRR